MNFACEMSVCIYLVSIWNKCGVNRGEPVGLNVLSALQGPGRFFLAAFKYVAVRFGLSAKRLLRFTSIARGGRFSVRLRI